MSEVVSDAVLIKARVNCTKAVGRLEQEAKELTVTSNEEYEEAAVFLKDRVLQPRKAWQAEMDPIIEPIRTGLDMIYALRKKGVDAFDAAEKVIKGSMKEFKLEEARLIRQADEDKRKKQQELADEARRKEEALAKAKSPALKRKLEIQHAEIEQKAVNIEMAPAYVPVKSASAGSRTSLKWQCDSKEAFISHIAQHPDLCNLLQIDQVQMNALFRLEKSINNLQAGKWMPGISIIEDIDITGRSR